MKDADDSTNVKRRNVEKQQRYIEHLKTPDKKTERNTEERELNGNENTG